MTYTHDELRAMSAAGYPIQANRGTREVPRWVTLESPEFTCAADLYRVDPAALSAAPGWVLVPREPTDEMCAAAAARIEAVTTTIQDGPLKGATLVPERYYHAYVAMVGAAPSPPNFATSDTSDGDYWRKSCDFWRASSAYWQNLRDEERARTAPSPQQPAEPQQDGGAVAWRYRYSDSAAWLYKSTRPNNPPPGNHGGKVIEPLYTTPQPAARRVTEWTDEQCLAFAATAFRHAPKNLPTGVTLFDIKLGARQAESFANGGA